jgi:hypothetical protein
MKFKCKSTNLIYDFEFEVDIMSMMKHPDYEPMDETPAAEETKPAKTTKKPKVATDETGING